MKELLIKLPEEILSATKVKEEEAPEAIRKIVALELFVLGKDPFQWENQLEA